MLQYFSDRYQTHTKHEKAVDAYPPSIEYVPDWLSMSEMLVVVDNAGLNKLITWCNRYKQCKARKKRSIESLCQGMASIKMVGLVYSRRRKKIIKLRNNESGGNINN